MKSLVGLIKFQIESKSFNVIQIRFLCQKDRLLSCSFQAYQSSFPSENKKTTGKILRALFLSFFGAKIGQNCLSKPFKKSHKVFCTNLWLCMKLQGLEQQKTPYFYDVFCYSNICFMDSNNWYLSVIHIFFLFDKFYIISF